MGIKEISDQLLLESYNKAKSLKNDEEYFQLFIELLKQEIERRNLKI